MGEPLTATTLEPDAASVPWSFEDSPTVEVTPATGEQPAAGAEGAAGAQPATAAPVVPTGPSVEELQRQLNEVTAQLRDVAGQRDTAVSASSIAQALVAAQAEQRRQWEVERQTMATMAPPTLTEDEKARIIADPDLLWEKILDVNRRGAMGILSAIDNRLSKADIMHDLGQPLVDIAATVAENQAREMAAARGIDPDTFDTLKEQAAAYIGAAAQSTGNPHAAQLNYTKMMLNPSAVLAAVEHVQRTSAGGVPTNKQRPPATIGTGDSSAARRAMAPPKPASVARMERDLGRAFSPTELAAAAEKAKEFDRVL